MITFVIDPGHGGDTTIGHSSSNNATSASGVKEKTICLDIAKRLKKHLEAVAMHQNKDLSVVLTRESDINLSLSDRANTASEHHAEFYLSIHCNGYNGKARGTECWIDRKYMQPKVKILPGDKINMPGPGVPSSGLRNINVEQDADFAKAIVDATVSAFQAFDNAAKLRSDRYTKKDHGESYVPPSGVKMMGLGTLRDVKLGTENNNCRAALLELEFIDNPKVDALLNGAEAVKVREKLASGLANAVVTLL